MLRLFVSVACSAERKKMGAAVSCGGGTRVLPLLGQGSYSVGCADMMVKDGPNGDSGVFMRIFYPVDHKDVESSHFDEDCADWLPRKEYLQVLHILKAPISYTIGTRKLNENLPMETAIHLRLDNRMPALWERPLSGSKQSSCVVPSFSIDNFTLSEQPGIKSEKIVLLDELRKTERYSTYCASLASYGFIVAAIEHRDFSACWTFKMVPDAMDGRLKEREVKVRHIAAGENEFKVRGPQLHKRVSECVRALHVLEELNMGQIGARGENSARLAVGEHFNWRQFKGRLDMSRVATVGHSFGGATALGATAFSTEFQAAVVLDGWMFPIEEQMYNSFTQPSLFLNSGTWQWRENVDKMVKSPLSDATHQSFTDFAFLVRNSFMAKRMGLSGETDPQLIGEAVVELTVAFLRKTFSGYAAQQIVRHMAKERYPFIIDGTNIDAKEGSKI